MELFVLSLIFAICYNKLKVSANNIDKLTTKEIKALAGDLFIEGRSKKKVSELKTDIIKELNSGTRGSENLEDCIGSSPNLQKVITIDEFVATYHK